METLEEILKVVTSEQMEELFAEDPTMEKELAELALKINQPILTKNEAVETDESLSYIVDELARNQGEPTVEVVIGFYMTKMSRDDLDDLLV